MTEVLYIKLSNDSPEGEDGDWIRADVVLDGSIVATGFAPERPPYVDYTAKPSAVALAMHKFREVLLSDQRCVPGYKEKKVKGPS